MPVLGPLDVTTTELAEAALNALRLTALGLAFAAYALLLDHDRLVAAAGGAALGARGRSCDPARARARARRRRPRRVGAGRGVRPRGRRGYATLLSPLVAGSLERATGLAEAMEARGFGRSGATRAPRPPWSTRDRLALPLAGSARPGGGAVALASVVDSRSRTRRRRRRCGTSRSSSSPARSSRCSARPARASRRCSARSPGSCRTSTAAASPAGSSSPGSTRARTRPAELAGTVATVFQDPEDQVVMTIVANEVAFGLENLGVRPPRSGPASSGARRGRRAPPLGPEDDRALRRRAPAGLSRLRARARAAAAAARRADLAARSRGRRRSSSTPSSGSARPSSSPSTASPARSSSRPASSSSTRAASSSTPRARRRRVAGRGAAGVDESLCF